MTSPLASAIAEGGLSTKRACVVFQDSAKRSRSAGAERPDLELGDALGAGLELGLGFRPVAVRLQGAAVLGTEALPELFRALPAHQEDRERGHDDEGHDGEDHPGCIHVGSPSNLGPPAWRARQDGGGNRCATSHSATDIDDVAAVDLPGVRVLQEGGDPQARLAPALAQRQQDLAGPGGAGLGRQDEGLLQLPDDRVVPERALGVLAGLDLRRQAVLEQGHPELEAARHLPPVDRLDPRPRAAAAVPAGPGHPAHGEGDLAGRRRGERPLDLPPHLPLLGAHASPSCR